MDFGARFHALREAKGLNEDQIASYFGVTWKEIAAWEKGKSEPSLSMLTRIAVYFGVTTDSLLGADSLLEESLIAGYLERYQSEILENRLPEAIAVMREGLLHFPENYRLKYMLMYALYLSCTKPAAVKHYTGEIVSLAEDILSSCTDDTIRLEARRVLCLHYCDDLKDTAKATEVAKLLPARQSCKEEMLTHISAGEEKITVVKGNILSYSERLAESILQLARAKDSLTKEERHTAVTTVGKILDLLYPGEGDGEAALQTLTLYKELGIFALREGMTDEGFAYLEKAARAAVAYDALPEKSSYRSPLLKDLPLVKEKSNQGEAEDTDSAAGTVLASLRILDAMEALRYDKRLEAILLILSGENS